MKLDIVSMNLGNHRHMLNILLLTFLLWLMGIHIIFPQHHLFDVEFIGVEDGLPNRVPHYIVQDKEGFIWVSTQGTISRYDGYGFKSYGSSFLNVGETSGIALAIDINNRLWYCEGSQGMHTTGIIDPRKDSIHAIETITQGRFKRTDITHITNSKVNSNEIIITTRSGVVYKYNETFEEIYRLSPPVSSYFACEASPDGSYWLINGENIIHIKDQKHLKTIPVGAHPFRIISVHPELILKIDNPSDPIEYWTIAKDTIIPYTIPPHAPEDITGVLQLHEKYNCYTVKNELLIRDKKGELLYRFNVAEATKYTDKLRPRTALLDRQQLLWITTDNGIIKLKAKQNPFEVLLPGIGIRGIFKDKEDLWIGGDRRGNVIPPHIISDQEYLDPDINDAMAFYKDTMGHLWIGTTSNQIIEYNPKKDTYTYYNLNFKASLQIPFQNAITGNYWIGTDNGLVQFDKNKKRITPFSLPATSRALNIRQFYRNKQGIWIISNKGIFLMDAEKETLIKHYTTADGLPVNSILHIYEDKEGIFWLGTQAGGLVRWDIKANTFIQYTTEDGLSNNKIYAVYEDDQQTLWMPSDYGLMAFDKHTATTTVYLPRNGIAHEEFNRFSHFRAKDSTLYFGSLSGITKFHPKNLRNKTRTAIPLYVTRMRVLQKDAATFKDRTPEYNATKKISLYPEDRILELDISLLDYESSINQYAYKLSSKQEQWIYTGENKLSIINPPYGRYNLVIKARGASGTWSERPLNIPIYVRLPFYRQWWFILTVALLTVAIVILAVRWRITKLEKDRQRLEGEVRKRTWQIEKDKDTITAQAEALKTLDKAKTRFFANITHEFRTPLTLVSGPITQILSKKPSVPFKKELQGVLKNAHNLLDLINQLLDLSKLESGQMKTEISYGNIVSYTSELVQRFTPMADAKQLHLNFTAATTVWKTHFDSDKWTKIIYNLLSNAIKFTEKGSIEVRLKQLQHSGREYIQLRVKDTGIGIAPENQEHIFNRFYQTDSSSTRLQGGTGIGLSLVKELTALQNGNVTVESNIGQGTAFTILLPVVETAIPKTLTTDDLESPIAQLPVTAIQNGTIKARQEKAPDQKLELLIIEDNAEMCSYIGSCIDLTMYRISEAKDGKEGIAKAQEMIPDLIISDVMMPKRNGFEVTQAIRSHTVTSHIPLILLTAKASLESRLEGLERGADAYLTKPFSPEELQLRIKKLIELRQQLQQRYQNNATPPKNNVFKKEDTFITVLKTYILKNIRSDLTVNRLSSHFAMSEIQFYRKLKALTNTSVANYVRALRMEKAMQLLKEQHLNVSEVTYETGFSSPSHFSRTFRKYFGKAPSEFR